MRPSRLVTSIAAAAVLAVGPLAGFANAQSTPSGVGTGNVASTVVSVQLGGGDVLSVRLLGDDGLSTIDPAKGAPSASHTFRPLTISSKLVPALNVSAAEVATSSTGGEDKKSLEDLVGVPQTPAFSGQVNALLSSVVDTAGARSGLLAGLANVKLAGGLVNIPTGGVDVSSKAVGTEASGTRSITIPAVNVLDLSAVLEGLGLDLADLPVSVLLDLIGGLGLPVPDVSDPSAAVASLNSAIDFLQGQSGNVTASICGTVDGLLGSLGGVSGLSGLDDLPVSGSDPSSSLPIIGDDGTIDVPPIVAASFGYQAAGDVNAAAVNCTSLTGTVQELLDEVQDALSDLLKSILALLDGAPLLAVTDVNVSIVAKAADTVGNSVADVTASIGSVKVGNLAVPGVSGLNLTDAAAVVNQAVETIEGTIGSLLGNINTSLADLVDVDVLKIEKAINEAAGYTNATSKITALTATITPPALLGSAALLDLDDTPVSSVLATLGSTVPALAPVMGQLEAALGGIEALTSPSTVTVGELSAAGTFRAASAGAPAPTGQLPRTGGSPAVPAMLAVLLGGLALAIRRVVRSTAV